MTDLIRRFRGLGVALAVLALSAGAVFAAAPRISLVGDSHTTVEQPASEVETPDAEEPTGADEDQDADEAEDADDATDKTDAENADAAAEDTHGALVSDAAQMDTPEGFRNHGAFVACVAHSDKDAAVPLDLTTVTPESCGLTPTPAPDAAADTQSGKAKGEAISQEAKAKGHAKAEAGKAKGKAKSGR